MTDSNSEPTFARILIVEDDKDLADLEVAMLKKAGHNVRAAYTGTEGIEAVETFHPEVVLLDVDLPDISGFDVCTHIVDKTDAFIIFLTGRGLEDEQFKGLNLGADDYLVKPFRAEKVLTRIAALMRRRDRARAWQKPGDRSIGDGTFMRYSTHMLEREEKKTSLTSLEFKLLQFLTDAPGTLWTRGQILEHVWRDTSGIETRVVDVHMVAIRKKLSDLDAAVEIVGVRGVGYRFGVKAA